MAEQAEIPEAADPFGKRVAVCIAMIAVIMALISNRGDDAKTDALLKSTEAANQWAYYQAKSIKQHTYEVQIEVLGLVQVADPAAREKTIEKFSGQVKKYEAEKKEIKAEAEKLGHEAKEKIAVNDSCDRATLFMQLAIVACSVAILAKLAPFWWGGIGLGLVGAILGVTSFWAKPEGGGKAKEPEHPAAAPAEHHG